MALDEGVGEAAPVVGLRMVSTMVESDKVLAGYHVMLSHALKK